MPSEVFSIYKPTSPGEGPSLAAGKWDAIVIGSGMGGSACAAALSKAGSRVLLLEQHYNAGGFSHTFSRKGYTWDVGVHCVGEMGPRNLPGKLLSWLSDGRIEMAPIGPAYDTAYFPDGTVVEYPTTGESSRPRSKTFSEEEAIARYFE